MGSIWVGQQLAHGFAQFHPVVNQPTGPRTRQQCSLLLEV